MQLETISRFPSVASRPNPLLFVHGAWHGAWCWQKHFLEYFARHGYAAHALSLRGHGQSEGRNRLRWTRISEYVADIAQVAEQLPAPPILIGHSMGGLVVQKYLEEHTAPASILLASVPPTGVWATTLHFLWHHPIKFIKANLTLSLFPLINTPRLAQEAFFSSDISEQNLQTYAQNLQDESYMAFLDMLFLNLPEPRLAKTPILVLGAASDTIFSTNKVEATAKAYNTQAIVFPKMAHDMMLEEGWEAVANQIRVWLREREL